MNLVGQQSLPLNWQTKDSAVINCHKLSLMLIKRASIINMISSLFNPFKTTDNQVI